MKRDVAIVGAGYVGVPLARVFAEAGKRVVLVDASEERAAMLNRGESYIEDVPSEKLKELVTEDGLSATTDYDVLRESEAIVIDLPTPLSKQREPDLSIILGAAQQITLRLQRGQLVVLESTTYPGTTREILKPILERGGKVNENMPYFCRSLISQALNHGAEKSLKGSRVLLLGVAYKADIGDIRESPALKIIQLLQIAGSEVSYHEPHVPQLPEHGLSSVGLDPGAYDCVVIITAHSSIDYDKLVEEARLVVDLRNATGRNGSENGKVFKL